MLVRLAAVPLDVFVAGVSFGSVGWSHSNGFLHICVCFVRFGVCVCDCPREVCLVCVCVCVSSCQTVASWPQKCLLSLIFAANVSSSLLRCCIALDSRGFLP